MKSDIRDHLILWASLIITFFLVYYTPRAFYFIVLLIFPLIFIYSKKPYLWIIYLLVLIEYPGGLFYGGTRQESYRLPLYSITAGISLSYEQIFILVAFLKALLLKGKINSFLKKPLKNLGIYFIFLVFIGILLGSDFDSFRNLYKIVINLTLYYSIFKLMDTYDKWIKFFNLIFPFVFVAIYLQLYSLILRHQLITFFKPDIITTQGVLNVQQGYVNRPIEMVHIILLAFLGSLYFLLTKDKRFNLIYLVIVNVLCYIAIWITATRAWVLGFTMAYFISIILSVGTFGKNIIRYSLLVISAFILISSITLLRKQFLDAFERIRTVEYIAEGDITAGGTLQRFDKRGPAVIKAFLEESTIIFGAGFGKTFFTKGDGHVGFHNWLLNAGIVGALLYLLLIRHFILKLLFLRRKLKFHSLRSDEIIVFIAILLTILLIHSSAEFFCYQIGISRILVICTLFGFSSVYFNQKIELLSVIDRKLSFKQ